MRSKSLQDTVACFLQAVLAFFGCGSHTAVSRTPSPIELAPVEPQVELDFERTFAPISPAQTLAPSEATIEISTSEDERGFFRQQALRSTAESLPIRRRLEIYDSDA